MTAMASVSSPWIPEDDLLLKNSIEAGASLEALAKGAVEFSRRFTFRELRDRWHSLLYDPGVSAQASVSMAELELFSSNPPSKFDKSDNLKGSENAHQKRKSGSIRRHYYAMRKRIKNEFLNSSNLDFFEDPNLHNYSQHEHNFQDHLTTNHEASGGDAMVSDCLANNLGLEETDFEILRQAFPESLGSIATTTTITTTRVIDNNNNPTNAFHTEGCHKAVQNDFINGSFTEDVFEPNIEMKNATHMGIEESDPSQNGKIFKTDNKSEVNENNQVICSGFGGKQHFNSPVSDGSASFQTMGFSSPSARLPLWKTMEDVSAPDMPIDENNIESHQISEETLALPEGCNHIRESPPGYDPAQDRPNGFINNSEYTDLPDSLLNFSNDDDILLMDEDARDTINDLPNPRLPGSPKDVLCNTDATPSLVASPNRNLEFEIPSAQCTEESKDSSFHNDPDSLQLTEGKIICTLNRQDPEIPCNDDIFLLIHPSTSFASSVGLQIATDSIGPLSSSLREKNGEQGLSTVKKGKDSALCSVRSQMVGSNVLPEFVSAHSLVGSVFKRESPDAEYLVPLPGKPNNLRIPSQSRSVHMGLESTRNGLLEQDASKAELRGLDTSAIYSEMPLPVEAGSVKMINQESMDNSYLSDQNNSDNDDDVPHFSDVEAMILEMDLTHAQESCITAEVARYQNEGTRKMIIRLEQAARSSLQRAMSSLGVFAFFFGEHLKHYIKKTEVTIGRSTDDTQVDIDLRKEGRANKISRRQATIKMETDGSFNLKNLGASSILLNGKEIVQGQVAALSSSCLIEIRGMCFVFEINDKYVRRFLENQPR